MNQQNFYAWKTSKENFLTFNGSCSQEIGLMPILIENLRAAVKFWFTVTSRAMNEPV